jgi:hypothetical protein
MGWENAGDESPAISIFNLSEAELANLVCKIPIKFHLMGDG